MKLMIKKNTLFVVPETTEEEVFFKSELNLDSHPRSLTITTDGGSFVLRRELPVRLGQVADLITPDVLGFMKGLPDDTIDALRDLGLM